MDIVYVEWIDSSRTGGWTSGREAVIPYEKLACESIGFLVNDSEDSITITSSLAMPERGCLNALTIPKCAIRKMHYVVFDK